MCIFMSGTVLAESPGITKDSIKVGAIVDFSGPVVYTMTQEHYGQIAYFRKAFAEGIYNRKIIVKAEDGGYNPSKHLAGGKLLLDREKVFCLILSVGTSPTLALNNLLEARKVPLTSVGAQSRALAVPHKRYIFNQMTSYYDQARVCVDHIVSQNPKAKIAIICQDDTFGYEGRDGFLAQCKKYGIQPAGVVTYQRGAKDFSAPVLKLKSLNPDYVINHGIPAYGAAVLKEAHKLAWKPKWVVMAGTFKIFIKMAGKSMDYAGEVYAVKVNAPSDGDTPGAVEFREAIKKYHKKAKVDYAAMVGYGFGKILVEGLKRAEANNNLTREGLVNALETLRNFNTGVFPPITYTQTSHAGPDSCLLVKRQGDTWVPVSNKWLKAK